MRQLMLLLFTAGSALATDHAFLTLEQTGGSLSGWQTIFVRSAMLTSDGKLNIPGTLNSSAVYRLKIQTGPALTQN